MTDSEKLDFIIEKLISIDQKMDTPETRMDALENRMDALETRVGILENKVGILEDRVGTLENKVDSMEKRLSIVEIALADDRRENRLTRSIIENEVNYHISLIAEGHYDLNRKVDEAIHTTSDVAAKEEIYDVKFVEIFDDDVSFL